MVPRHIPRPAAAFRRRVLPATLALLLGGTVSAAPMSAWRELAADPRAAHADSMTAQERWNLAREYGLEGYLPQPNSTTRYYSNCGDSGTGSLRAAVASAVSGDSVAPQNLACSTISLTTGEIVIGVDSLYINGPGRTALTVRNGATNGHGRVFRHTGTGSLFLFGMTVADGFVTDNTPGEVSRGGCIYSKGSVVLGNPLDLNPAETTPGVIVRDCAVAAGSHNALGGGVFASKSVSLNTGSIVSGCRVTALSLYMAANGGGVYASGAGLGMKYSEIRDNRAEGDGFSSGGGAKAVSAADMSIVNSTIAGNYAKGDAGGADLQSDGSGTVKIERSTISGNSAGSVSGVSISNADGDVKVVSSTITANTSNGNRAALELYGDTIALQGSLVSGNHSAGQRQDLHLVFFNTYANGISGANNLIGVATGDPPPPSGLIVSNTPGLAPLVNNGGSTRTHALLASSPAIDKGIDDDSIHYDQRGPGYPRKVGAHTDIGAFERDPDVIFFNGFD